MPGLESKVAAQKLIVSHIIDTLPVQSAEGIASAPIPLSKPATPQVDYTAPALDIYSKSERVGVVFPISYSDNWGATIYAELILDGASRGVHTTTAMYGEPSDWGDFDPQVPHHIQIYYWAETGTHNVSWCLARARSGTVSDVAKVVWEKTIPYALFVFSTAGISDTTHLYVDDTLVTDYALWWSGSKIVYKGTNFNLNGNLIYQKINVQ